MPKPVRQATKKKVLTWGGSVFESMFSFQKSASKSDERYTGLAWDYPRHSQLLGTYCCCRYSLVRPIGAIRG